VVHVLKDRVQDSRRLRKSPGSQIELSVKFDSHELMILQVLDSAARLQNPVASIALDTAVTSQGFDLNFLLNPHLKI